jgi:hypothetical protein
MKVKMIISKLQKSKTAPYLTQVVNQPQVQQRERKEQLIKKLVKRESN